jgi:hypothetical protein
MNPDEKQIEQLLENSSLTPGARLDRRLTNAPWTPQAVARRRFVNAAVFAVLTLVVLLAVTPQGRAFAQNIFRYFTRTEGDTRPVPTVALADPNKPAPTSLPVKRLPFEETCGDLFTPRCTVNQIRSMVDFQISGLEATPDQVDFVGATGGPEQVTLVYAGEGLNGMLMLSEQPANPNSQQLQVAASATIETVFVGGVTGEYVQGGWFSLDTDDDISWNPDPTVQTLRWEANGILYTMSFRAAKMGSGILLDKSAMLDLAGNLTVDVVNAPEPTPAVGLDQISAQAGFTVFQPTWMPKGYVFLEAAYIPGQNTACLYYTMQGGDNSPVLAIAERPADADSILEDITSTAADVNGQQVEIHIVTELLNVGGVDGGQAVLASNGVNAGLLCPHKDFIANQALYWESDGKDFVVFGLLDQYQGGVFVSHLDMQRIAESLTGVITIPADQIDPGHLNTVKDADTLASFDVKAPTQMAVGVQFDHAAYSDDGQAKTIRLVYTPGSPTRGGIDYGFFITQAKGTIRTLDEVYLWGGFDHATVNGQDALYRKMCWDTPQGVTDCYQELYWDENDIGYDIMAYFPGALEKDKFLAIAESMK